MKYTCKSIVHKEYSIVQAHSVLGKTTWFF